MTIKMIGIETIRNIVVIIAALNIIGFILMWHDKRCAQNGQWRVKERTLLLLSLVGGSVGTLLGMYKFRHKTKHAAFKYGIPLIIILQVSFIIAVKLNLLNQLWEALKTSIQL